jgi:hypothetical protein
MARRLPVRRRGVQPLLLQKPLELHKALLLVRRQIPQVAVRVSDIVAANGGDTLEVKAGHLVCTRPLGALSVSRWLFRRACSAWHLVRLSTLARPGSSLRDTVAVAVVQGVEEIKTRRRWPTTPSSSPQQLSARQTVKVGQHRQEGWVRGAVKEQRGTQRRPLSKSALGVPWLGWLQVRNEVTSCRPRPETCP